MSETTTTNDTPNLTVTLDLFGETRTVALRVYQLDSPIAQVIGLVAQQNGFAAKARYKETLLLWRVLDEKPAHKGNKVVTASDGSVWQFHLSTVVRNRQARFVGWADVVGATNFESNQRTAK